MAKIFGKNHITTLSTDNIPSNITYYGVTNTSSAVAITLPPLSTIKEGAYYMIKDETNFAATNNITILTSGSDKIDGIFSTYTINANNGAAVFFTRGTSWWSVGTNTVPGAGGVNFTKYTVPYTSFSTAANTNTISLFNIAAKGVISALIVKHSASFTGGTISAYTVSVGNSIDGTEALSSNIDVFSAPADTNFTAINLLAPQSFAAPTTITITATSTGDTLNHATAGSVDVWVATTILV